MKIIFAQGNPDSQYNNSRHNAGFMVLDALAASLGAVWVEKPRFHALVAETQIQGEKALLVKPLTYYNETGVSARQFVDFFKVSITDDFLVIQDEIDLPFGTIRIRKQGSDAGNNGIRSLIAHLGNNFHRIRIGTSNDLKGSIDGANFVLGKFSDQENKKLQSDIIPSVILDIKQFCNDGISATSQKI